jgi:putative endonuclease
MARPPDARARDGAAAEDLALAHLRAHGLALVARNHRCRQGEIDLVMRDGDTLVFVEVRLRSARAFASAAESIDLHKQRRVVAAARHFLAGRAEAPCRFDCVLLERLEASSVRWVRAAFEA